MGVKWDYSGIEKYITAKEYVDTAIVPLVQVNLQYPIKEALIDSTWLIGVANEMEEQLTGRVMLFPHYTYTGEEKSETLVDSLNSFFEQLSQNGFQNVVFLTQNHIWDSLKEKVKGEILIVTRESKEPLELSKDEHVTVANATVPRLIALWGNKEKMK